MPDESGFHFSLAAPPCHVPSRLRHTCSRDGEWSDAVLMSMLRGCCFAVHD